MNKLFDCKAIDHAITFLPTGDISPCCLIKNYTKDINEISNPNRFADLKIIGTPTNCINCVNAGIHSYKHTFAGYRKNIQMIDFRTSNLCNLKCRTCGPSYSSKWADELGIKSPIKKVDIDIYITQILTDSISKIYFAGGEPLLNIDHWNLLDKLIELNLARNISLQYSTNLTVITYKNKTVSDYWKQFKHVQVNASIDATGPAFEYIRSGANWEVADTNITKLSNLSLNNLTINIAFTLSVLSVWFLKDVLEYANSKKIKVSVFQLTDPHYLTLNVLPSILVTQCVSILQDCINIAPQYKNQLEAAISTANNNDDTGSFMHMISTVLLLDKIRNENLFDLLPFRDTAIHHILKNQ